MISSIVIVAWKRCCTEKTVCSVTLGQSITTRGLFVFELLGSMQHIVHGTVFLYRCSNLNKTFLKTIIGCEASNLKFHWLHVTA